MTSPRSDDSMHDEAGMPFDEPSPVLGRAHDGSISNRITDDQRETVGLPNAPRLMHLADTNDYKVADGDSDIRGWTVRTSDGHSVGKVTDLVIDTTTMKVRYLEAKLGFADGRSSEARNALISIRTARLDDKQDDVILTMTSDQARQLPTYLHGDKLTTEIQDESEVTAVDDGGFFGGRRQGREQSSYIASYRRPQDFERDSDPPRV